MKFRRRSEGAVGNEGDTDILLLGEPILVDLLEPDQRHVRHKNLVAVGPHLGPDFHKPRGDRTLLEQVLLGLLGPGIGDENPGLMGELHRESWLRCGRRRHFPLVTVTLETLSHQKKTKKKLGRATLGEFSPRSLGGVISRKGKGGDP